MDLYFPSHTHSSLEVNMETEAGVTQIGEDKELHRLCIYCCDMGTALWDP